MSSLNSNTNTKANPIRLSPLRNAAPHYHDDDDDDDKEVSNTKTSPHPLVQASSPTTSTSSSRLSAHLGGATSAKSGGDDGDDITRPTLRKLTSSTIDLLTGVTPDPESERFSDLKGKGKARFVDHGKVDGKGLSLLELRRRSQLVDDKDPSKWKPKAREVLVHRVTKSDTLNGVALSYGISNQSLRIANSLFPTDTLAIRSELYIPLDSCVLPAGILSNRRDISVEVSRSDGGYSRAKSEARKGRERIRDRDGDGRGDGGEGVAAGEGDGQDGTGIGETQQDGPMTVYDLSIWSSPIPQSLSQSPESNHQSDSTMIPFSSLPLSPAHSTSTSVSSLRFSLDGRRSMSLEGKRGLSLSLGPVSSSSSANSSRTSLSSVLGGTTEGGLSGSSTEEGSSHTEGHGSWMDETSEDDPISSPSLVSASTMTSYLPSTNVSYPNSPNSPTTLSSTIKPTTGLSATTTTTTTAMDPSFSSTSSSLDAYSDVDDSKTIREARGEGSNDTLPTTTSQTSQIQGPFHDLAAPVTCTVIPLYRLSPETPLTSINRQFTTSTFATTHHRTPGSTHLKPPTSPRSNPHGRYRSEILIDNSHHPTRSASATSSRSASFDDPDGLVRLRLRSRGILSGVDIFGEGGEVVDDDDGVAAAGGGGNVNGKPVLIGTGGNGNGPSTGSRTNTSGRRKESKPTNGLSKVQNVNGYINPARPTSPSLQQPPPPDTSTPTTTLYSSASSTISRSFSNVASYLFSDPPRPNNPSLSASPSPSSTSPLPSTTASKWATIGPGFSSTTSSLSPPITGRPRKTSDVLFEPYTDSPTSPPGSQTPLAQEQIPPLLPTISLPPLPSISSTITSLSSLMSSSRTPAAAGGGGGWGWGPEPEFAKEIQMEVDPGSRPPVRMKVGSSATVGVSGSGAEKARGAGGRRAGGGGRGGTEGGRRSVIGLFGGSET